jgi:tRNA A-37 threonylcarbamoyl transferase component Bud32
MSVEPSLELPSHFELQCGGRGVLAVRRDAALELERAGFSLEGDGRGRSAGLAGRHPVVLLGPPGRELVVRRFTHGGLLRVLTGARFADPRRPIAELLMSERLSAAGVRTPEVVAARARRASLFGWELALVTRRVPDARDGGELLAADAGDALAARERRRACSAAGALVGRLHALGFLHADLHPKNLLFGGDGTAWLLDLDRSRFESTLDPRTRARNLARLHRYVERRRARGEFALTRTDRTRFLCAYEPDPTRRRAVLAAVAHEFERTLRWHQLGWRLFGN